MGRRVVKRGGAVLLITEEKPTPWIFGDANVEKKVEIIRDFLWDTIFRYAASPKVFGELWESKLRPMAVRLLTEETYKTFHYFDPWFGVYISNDKELLTSAWWDVQEVALVKLVLEGRPRGWATTVEGITTDIWYWASPLKELRDYMYFGTIFAAYARDELEAILKALHEKPRERLGKVINGWLGSFASIIALSLKVEREMDRLDSQADSILRMLGEAARPAVFCFTCTNIVDVAFNMEAAIVRTGPLVDALEKMGFEVKLLGRASAFGPKRGAAIIKGEDVALKIVEEEHFGDLVKWSGKHRVVIEWAILLRMRGKVIPRTGGFQLHREREEDVSRRSASVSA